MQRRLKRDPENGYVGGVCEGLANYTNTDPILWRVIMIAGFITPVIPSLLFYIIVWMFTPRVDEVTKDV